MTNIWGRMEYYTSEPEGQWLNCSHSLPIHRTQTKQCEHIATTIPQSNRVKMFCEEQLGHKWREKGQDRPKNRHLAMYTTLPKYGRTFSLSYM
jgi:hypothetical protein